MSYKAKSSLAALAALCVVYGLYFLWAAAPGRAPFAVFAHMAGAALALALILVVLEVVIAVRSGAEAGDGDERDALIGLRSARNGYYALVSLIWMVPALALANVPAVLMANLCLGMLVVGEAVHFGSRVVYDRVGA